MYASSQGSEFEYEDLMREDISRVYMSVGYVLVNVEPGSEVDVFNAASTLSFVTDVTLEPSPDCILASLICITACSNGPLGTDCRITKTRRVVPNNVGIIKSSLLTI